MRLIIVLVCALIVGFPLAVQPAAAQSRTNPFETNDDARQRHNADRWNQYQQRGGQPPLGGYKSPLGDPAPRGTERPGYTSPQPYGSGSNPGWNSNTGRSSGRTQRY